MRLGETSLENYKLAQLKQKVDELCEKIKTGIFLEDFFQKENQLRAYCQRLFPEKISLYDLIYRSRFKRIWEQFRGKKIEFEEEEVEKNRKY